MHVFLKSSAGGSPIERPIEQLQHQGFVLVLQVGSVIE